MSNNKSRFPFFVFLVPVAIIVILGLVLVLNNRPPNIKVPAHKMPSPNAYDDFVEAIDLYNQKKQAGPLADPNRKPEQWTMAEYETYMADNALAMQKLREGLRKEYHNPPSILFDIPIKDFSGFRNLARTMVGEALYYERLGDYNSAMNSRLDCIEMGCMIPKGGQIIHGLVGVAIEAIGSSGIGANIKHLNSAELENAANRAEIIQAKRVPFSEIMEDEGDFVAANYSMVFSKPEGLLTGWGIHSIAPGNPVKLYIESVFCNKKKWILDVQGYYKAVGAEQKGYYKGRSKVPKPNNPLVDSIIDVDKCRKSMLMNEANIALIQSEIAICRYKADYGSYPDNLSQLVPKYIKKTPIDPYGKGKILKYIPVKNNQGFVLYSLGQNMKDDGGKPAKKTGLKTSGDLFLDKQQ